MNRNVLSRLFGFTTKTLYNWRKEDERQKNRPILTLIEKYFQEDDIKEFLETKKIERFDVFVEQEQGREQKNKLSTNYIHEELYEDVQSAHNNKTIKSLEDYNFIEDSVSFDLAELMDMSEKIEETEVVQGKVTGLSELMSSAEQEESDVKTEAMVKEEEDLLAEILASEDITEAEVNQIIAEELYGDITLEDLDSVVFDDEPKEDIGKKAKTWRKRH